jgi:N-methylhydantoinase A/oxoprolinase/acetone carboxylase beta subunit
MRSTNFEQRDVYKIEGVNCRHFAISLYLSGIPTRWEQEAGEAIKILEGMTGEKWVNDSTKRYFTAPTPGQLADFSVKQKSGYFLDEQRAQRELDKQRAVYKTEREKVVAEYDGKIKQAEVERDVKIAVLDAGLSLKNFIFYNCTSTGVFNWRDYDEKITAEQFAKFVAGVNIDGVKFEI